MSESGKNALGERGEALRAVLSQVPLILWTVDRDLRFTDSMGAERELLNQEPGDVRGMSLFSYFRTSDPNFEPIAAHRRALAGESVTYETAWNQRTFQTHVEPLRSSGGEVRGVIGVAFDVTERKKAEGELKKSIALLKATIDAAADGILVVDADGRIVDFNRRFVDLWGIPEEVAGRRDDGLALASVLGQLKDPAGFVKKVMTVYARPSTTSHDVIELKDGRLIERDSLPQVVDGEPVGRVWTFRDVSERRVAEEDVEQAASLLRATLEATADGILVVDREGRIVSSNRKFAVMWGIPDALMASGDDDELIAYVLDQLRDPDRFVRKIRELYQEPDAQSYDWLEFKDGRIFERYSHPQKIGDRTVGRVWSFHDATRMRQLEETLRRQARAFEHVSDAVIRMDLEGRIADWNTGAERMFGFSKEEMLGKTPSALAAPEMDRDLLRTALEAARKQGRWSGELPFVRKDGSRGVCDAVVVPLADEYGRAAGVLGVSRDITERRKLEQELRKGRETSS
jgi:two-component system sensor histidine kinase/response regulator